MQASGVFSGEICPFVEVAKLVYEVHCVGHCVENQYFWVITLVYQHLGRVNGYYHELHLQTEQSVRMNSNDCT